MDPDTGTLRVVQWLREIQLDSPGPYSVPADSHVFHHTVSAPVKPDPDLELPSRPSNFLLAPSESTQDNCKGSLIMNGTKLCPPYIIDTDGCVPNAIRTRSSSRSETTRLRELGLITRDDLDRASDTKDGDHIRPSESASQSGHHRNLPPRLLRQNAFCFDTKPATEEQATSKIVRCYHNPLENKACAISVTGEHDDDDRHQHNHAIAPYPDETTKLSLVSTFDDKRKKHVKSMGNPPSNDSLTQDVQAQKTICSGRGTSNPPEWPPKSQQSVLLPGCVGFLSRKFLHGYPFELTASEASIGTSKSQCTGDGSCIAIEDSEAGQIASIHNAESQPSPQGVQVEGTFGHDGDVQIPIFPYTHKSTRCRALSCPIRGKHEKGPYLHEGKLRAREGNIFGSSNPPPKIWEAYDRIKDSNGDLGGKDKDQVAARDVKIVTRFARHHFGQALEWGVEGSDSESEVDGARVE